jgi:hypothetical protein
MLMIGKAQAQGEHPFSIDVKGGELQTRGEFFLCLVDYVF